MYDNLFPFVTPDNITCAYPISDIYYDAPRILYYCVLLLIFLTIRYHWLSHIFLGLAVAYAGSAAIHGFIITSHLSVLESQDVTVPASPLNFDDWDGTTEPKWDKNTKILQVNPDAIELDIDATTAIVVSAYLVGLPLQTWSRTVRSSRINRLAMLLWNLCMLGGTICALWSWPSTNTAGTQYRFCLNDPGSYWKDDLPFENSRWQQELWREDWNSTLFYIFNNSSVWSKLSSNCLYPCFKSSQILRRNSDLVADTKSRLAKLHDPITATSDRFRPLLSVAIIAFSAAQVFLYLVSKLQLGCDTLQRSTREPQYFWRRRRSILEQLMENIHYRWSKLKGICFSRKVPRGHRYSTPQEARLVQQPPAPTHRHPIWSFSTLLVNITGFTTLVFSLTFSPIITIAFICWIEGYIRKDGEAKETIRQVGQWSPLVSVAIALVGVVLLRFQWHVALEEEIDAEIGELESRVRQLKDLTARPSLASEDRPA